MCCKNITGKRKHYGPAAILLHLSGRYPGNLSKNTLNRRAEELRETPSGIIKFVKPPHKGTWLQTELISAKNLFLHYTTTAEQFQMHHRTLRSAAPNAASFQQILNSVILIRDRHNHSFNGIRSLRLSDRPHMPVYNILCFFRHFSD